MIVAFQKSIVENGLQAVFKRPRPARPNETKPNKTK